MDTDEASWWSLTRPSLGGFTCVTFTLPAARGSVVLRSSLGRASVGAGLAVLDSSSLTTDALSEDVSLLWSSVMAVVRALPSL